jgi:hypothetical protein
MTLAQIPMLQQTAKYKEICEEIVETIQSSNADGIYNAFEAMGMYSF